jgi:two-component sensor histidine kinase/CHASE1-domain containing sensor protein
MDPQGVVGVAGRIVASGAIYYAAGRLALLMAIPPGYATAVWPAAGLGLVCVLVWGARVAPGIAIGSFFVNMATGFDDTSADAVARSLVVAGAIGCGAALEAVVGAHLIRRRVGFPSPLLDERQILRFLVLGGPVACLVSATIGVVTLSLAGVVPWSSFAFNLWTWWAGDTIGVLVFAPLGLMALRGGHAVWRRRRLVVGAPLVLGFVIVTAGFVKASGWERDRLATDFERRAAPIAAVLRSHLTKYGGVVTGLASYFQASENVTRSEFATFCRRAVTTHRGLLALSWNPRVAGSDRARLEETARADGLAAFQFTEHGANGGLVRAAERASYVPIYFVEPGAPNAAILGFDWLSEPVRRGIVERLLASPRLLATSRIDLVQDTGQATPSAGVLLITPVLDGTDGKVRGFVVAAFRIASMLEAALEEVDHAGTRVTLRDGSEPARPILADSAPGARAAASLTASFPIDFEGRSWILTVDDTAAAGLRSWQPWLVEAAGLFLVSLLGVVLLMTTGREAEREEMLARLTALNADLEDRVAARTKQLSASLGEREVLLQEVHHRVKNNLQVISSLINMQLRTVEAGPARAALQEYQSRVEAIALIHEQLYRSKDYARVPFSEYARTLVANVFDAAADPGRVRPDVDIEDVAVPVDKAIPCGLLLNELLTNALKHAFPGDGRGTVTVRLSRAGDELVLLVADDGVGLPAGFDLKVSESLGMELVTTLVEQLGATLDVSNAPGARFEIRFTLERVDGDAL